MFWRDRTTPEPAADATPSVLRLGTAGNSAASRVTLAHALICDGRYADALTELEVALADNPELTDGQLAKGLALARQHRFHEAIAPLQMALESGEQTRLAAFGLAAVYLRLEDYASALELSRQLLARDDQDAKVHALQGEIHHASDRLDEALAAFCQAGQLNPQLLVARRRYGEMLEARGRLEEARRELQAAAQLAPTDGQLLQSLAAVVRRLGRSAEAAGLYQQAMQFGRPTGELFIGMAECHLDSQRLFDAFNAARAAVTLNPESPAAHRLIARIYSQQGRQNEAQQHEAAAEKLSGTAAIAPIRLTTVNSPHAPSAK